MVREAEEVAKLGIPSVILFGLPEKKDEVGSEAWHDEGVVQQAHPRDQEGGARAGAWPSTPASASTPTHGHCGVVVEGEIDNDATLENLGRAALSYARAGADLVAPSGMMDGFVGFLRESLDEDGFDQRRPAGLLGQVRVGATTARSATRSTRRPRSAIARGYQMDPANVREAMREVALDVDEGADIVMVKPALAYLDVIAEVARRVRPADRRVQRVGRVRDAEGGGRERLDRLRPRRCWRR